MVLTDVAPVAEAPVAEARHRVRPKHREGIRAQRLRAVPRKFRPDIQGLRAIAVVLVVLYHAGVPPFYGGFVGVDVFFVISGYLITRQLYDEVRRGGRINFVKFYSRRARRLLPPVLLVITCTLVVAHYVLPYDQLKSLIKDVYYSAIYGVNFHFAAEGVQYQNAASPPSALQHFWSLAVEEQFYLFWPLLIALCAVIGRRRLGRGLMIFVIGAICIVTLNLSASISYTNAPLAYFSLQTRAWELGLGALVALSAENLARIPSNFMRVVGWYGLAAIIGSAVGYSDQTVYPGVAAIVPTLGAAALIASAVLRNSKTPETVLLERPFMQYGGRASYAWYLWHWPMLILLPAWVGHSLNAWENLEIICLAFWFAVLTYFLENASHRSSWTSGRWVIVGGALSVCIAICAVASTVLLPDVSTKGVARHALALRGADLTSVQNALSQSLGIHELPVNLAPTLDRATNDGPPAPKGCFATLADTRSGACVTGDRNATRTAVLVGDSHANQWLTPLSELASKYHWKLIELTKAACPLADVYVWNNGLNREYTECGSFRTWMNDEVAHIKPQLIIASQSNGVVYTRMSDTAWATATVSALVKLAGDSAQVAYIGDSPTTKDNTLTCLQQHTAAANLCTYERSAAYDIFGPRYRELAGALMKAGMGFIDVLDFFCTPTLCPSVVDNMLVHRDNGHVTDVYATWLTPMLAPIFPEAK